MRRTSASFRLLAVFVVALSAALLLGANDSEARFNSLGHKMICGCGCNQILLECNHVGCPLSDGMRNELASALQRGDSDDLILQAFVQKYGPTILAAPTTTGFNRVAWIMPFLVLLGSMCLAILVIRSWSQPPPPPPGGSATGSGSYLDEVRKETEL